MERPNNITELKRLSVAERILIVQELWDSIAADHEQLELTDEQRDELDRRLSDYKLHPEEGFTWEEVKDAIRKSK